MHKSEDPVVRLKAHGTFEIWDVFGNSLLPRGRKAQAIVAYLALSGEEWVPRGRFRELLWSLRWNQQAQASLRQSIKEIRSIFSTQHPHLIDIERDRMRINKRLIWVDGYTQRPDEDAIGMLQSATARRGRPLETLIGLDPVFDAWISEAPAVLDSMHWRVPASPLRLATRIEAVPAPFLDETGDAKADVPRDARLPPPTKDGARYRIVVHVAPFSLFGSQPQDAHIPLGLTEEFATALARFRWFLVTLRAGVTPEGASYRLEGHVRRLEHSWRLSVRLIDQNDCDAVVWTHSEDAGPDQLDAMMSGIVERTVQEIDPEIFAIESRKRRRQLTQSCSALELLLLAIPLIYRFDVDAWRQATTHLEQAVALDPDFGRAYAFSALCRITGLAQGWTPYDPSVIAMVSSETAKAIACDPNDSLALTLSGHMHAFVQHDFKRAADFHDQAVHANPSCGFAWTYSAMTFAYQGQTDEALRRIARARSILRHDPFSSFLDGPEAVTLFFRKDWEGTIVICERILRTRPQFSNIRKLMIGALCQLGRFEEAKQHNGALLSLDRSFSWTRHLKVYPFARDADRRLLEGALVRANLMAVPAAMNVPVDILEARHRLRTA